MERFSLSNFPEIIETKEVKMTDVKVVVENMKPSSTQHSRKSSGRERLSFDASHDIFPSSELSIKSTTSQGYSNMLISNNFEKVTALERKSLSSPIHPKLKQSNQTASQSKRSVSPLKGNIPYGQQSQVGRSSAPQKALLLVKNVNYTSCNDASFANTEIDGDTEDSENSDSDWESFEKKLHTKIKQKRLSVQDVIHLFEKRRRETGEIPMAKTRERDNSKDSEVAAKFSQKRREIGELTMVKSTKNDNVKDSEETVAEKPLLRHTRFANLKSGVATGRSKGNGCIESTQAETPRMKLMTRKQELDKNTLRASHGSETALSTTLKGVVNEGNADFQTQKESSLHSKLRPQRKSMPLDSASTRFLKWENAKLMPNNPCTTIEMGCERHNELVVTNSVHTSADKGEDKDMEHIKILASESSAVASNESQEQTPAKTIALAVVGTEPDNTQAELAEAANATLIDKHVGVVTKYLHPCMEAEITKTKESHQSGDESTGAPSGQPQKPLKAPSILSDRFSASNGDLNHSPSEDLFKDQLGYATLSNNLWSNFPDFQLKRIADMADSEDVKDEEQTSKETMAIQHNCSERFYEQYSQKRDARLRQESDAKKAEREAKMKAMQELFERRAAELSSPSFKAMEKSMHMEDLVRSQSLQPIRLGLPKSRTDNIKKETAMDYSSQSRHSTGGLKSSSTLLELSQHGSFSSRLERLKLQASKSHLMQKASSSSQQKYLSSVATPRIVSRSLVAQASNIVPNNSSICAIPLHRGSSDAPAKGIKDFLSHPNSSSFLDLQKDRGNASLPCSESFLPTKLLSIKTYPAHSKGMEGIYSTVQATDHLLSSKLHELPAIRDIYKASPMQQPREVSSDDQFDKPQPTSIVEKDSKHISCLPAQSGSFDQSDLKETPVSERNIEKENECASLSSCSTAPHVEGTDSEGTEMFCSMQFEDLPTPLSGDPMVTDMDVSEADQSQRSLQETRVQDRCDHIERKYGSCGNKPYLDSSPAGKKDVQQLQDKISSNNCIPSSVSLKLNMEAVISSNDELKQVFETKESLQHGDLHKEESTLALSLALASECSQTDELVNKADIDSSTDKLQVSSVHVSKSNQGLKSSINTGSPLRSPIHSTHNIDPVQLSRSVDTCNPPFSPARAQSSQKSFSPNSQHAQKEAPRGLKRLLKFGRKSRNSEQTNQEWSVDNPVDDFQYHSAIFIPKSASNNSDRVAKAAEAESVNSGSRSFFSLPSFRGRSSESKSKS